PGSNGSADGLGRYRRAHGTLPTCGGGLSQNDRESKSTGAGRGPVCATRVAADHGGEQMSRAMAAAAPFAIACDAQQFEIASVKANTSDSRVGSFELSADRLTARNTYLGVLIQRAYGLDEMQLPKASAVPVMLAKYDVDAKAPHPANRAELLAM